MAFFAVETRTISKSEPHPDADRLDITQIEGTEFQFVTGRDEFKAGDICVYIPLDSVLPQALCDHLGLGGKLAGPEMNRVKTVKLRGIYSQGLAVKHSVITEYLKSNGFPDGCTQGLTDALGITKYDPEPVPCKGGQLLPLPEGQSVFDIEGADRYQHVVVNDFAGIPCWISEKLEGYNFSIAADKIQIWVNQREYTIVENEGETHEFWNVARAQKLTTLIREIHTRFSDAIEGVDKVILYGELIGPGIMGNHYELQKKEVRHYGIQLIMVNGNKRFVSYKTFVYTADELNFLGSLVPIVAEDIILADWLAGRSMKEASNGPSLLNNKKRREGIVVVPTEERTTLEIGRLMIKQRSPEYLAKSKF